jgi:tetratricopeptide (TPR) repeat protein
MAMRFTRSVLMLVVAVVMGASARLGAQESPRTLFESGNFQGVLDQTPDDSPVEALYVKALAYLKLGQNDPAKDVFRRLGGGGDAWRLTGESALAQVDGNLDAALSSAQAAVAADAAVWAAHYQLGLVLEARGESPAAADAFAKAAEANPQMAYAHYNAGMNFYKAQRVDLMAVYFENFLKLAPNAPERPAVESIMRTLRGR